MNSPHLKGYFGPYGGRFAPESLMTPLIELEEAYHIASMDLKFQEEYQRLLKDFVGRETPLTFAEQLSKFSGGAKIYLKREDLAHTGAHKINNALGQILLAVRMGKKRIIAETGAGQHGVATASVAARFGLECIIYMGDVDIKRQAPNVKRMKLLGAKVIPVTYGTQTLKDAVSEAMRDWVSNVYESFYILGSALGPHPYPTIVRDFQSIIGTEARYQILEKTGKLPDELIACVGGGSNAIGLFYPFLGDPSVRMVGVEAGGKSSLLGENAARFESGSVGVLQGTKTYVLQNSNGQISKTYSVSAGLDYAAVGPEHAWLKDQKRAEYVFVRDEEAISAFKLLSKLEGIIPALESSHAIAYGIRRAKELEPSKIILINLSGRGDKDLDTVIYD